MLQGIADGKLWLWVVGEQPVHLSGANPPTFGVVRIGPVYTPAEHRGRGYAAHVVAVLSRRALDTGHRVCLYTDQANPVSNRIYERLGYEALGDETEFRVTPPMSGRSAPGAPR
ncbi:GNAT family N-acetyltransferase [Mobilicoccus caccae]|uniref:N-acetyltransferase domain-containing protein n=1 Tax=Mobilicoccus caccae TaxID=1859295 RepID=A0ABQ6IQP7_9MICO|nr:GNAT family N-acetyltransferase [Mobilicoccus caccae]GMA39598.1 hypothetical protein GCM10025883_16430 [Mobilicoccus caccae]